MKEKIKQYMNKMELIFKITYLLLVLATFNSFLYTTSLQPLLVKITLVAGVLLGIGRVVLYKQYIKMPMLVLLILFCASFFVTTVVNRNYGGIVENGKWIIWTGIQFLLLYVGNPHCSKKKWKDEFCILSTIMIVYSSIAALISIAHLLTNTGFLLKTLEGEIVIAGFQWGRLWGVYTDPNYGAVFSVICIVLAFFFAVQGQKIGKIICGISMFLNGIYFIFSDSRTGEIAFVCCLSFLILGYVLQRRQKTKEKKTMVLGGIAIVVCVIMSLVVISGTKMVYNKQLAPMLVKIFPKEVEQTEEKKNEVKKSEVKKSEVGRKKDLENNVSNGRVDIWKSSLEIWRTTPVVGTGYSTALAYAQKNCPDTYMALRGYTSAHNTFLNVLLYQGVVGAALFALIILKLLLYYLKVLRQAEEEERQLAWTLVACVGAVAAGMFFLAEGIYTNSMGAFVLWTFSGYIVLQAYDKKGGTA